MSPYQLDEIRCGCGPHLVSQKSHFTGDPRLTGSIDVASEAAATRTYTISASAAAIHFLMQSASHFYHHVVRTL